jgi:hypothetical protein
VKSRDLKALELEILALIVEGYDNRSKLGLGSLGTYFPNSGLENAQLPRGRPLKGGLPRNGSNPEGGPLCIEPGFDFYVLYPFCFDALSVAQHSFRLEPNASAVVIQFYPQQS